MNVYLIKDGGDQMCWKAETMQSAVAAAEDAYVADPGNRSPDETDADMRAHYQAHLLESCQLLGELAND